jgi:hypothetical protein
MRRGDQLKARAAGCGRRMAAFPCIAEGTPSEWMFHAPPLFANRHRP